MTHDPGASPDCWADGFGRWHALVPITCLDPREIALDIMALKIADRERKSGETFAQAIDRVVSYLDGHDRVVVNLGVQTQRIARLGGMVEYVEYALERDEL